MSGNKGLTREMAVQLIRMEPVLCPACGQCVLVSRYGWKKQNIEYKCSNCGELYHPCKLI